MWTKNQDASALFFPFALVLLPFCFIFIVTNVPSIKRCLCVISKYSIEDILFYIVHYTIGVHMQHIKSLFFVSFYSILPLSFLAPVSFSLSLQRKPFVALVRSHFPMVRYVSVERFRIYLVLF